MEVADKKATQKSAKRTTGSSAQAGGFSAEERAAIKARAKEQKAEARRSADRAEGEKAVIEVIAAMTPSDRAIAERLHAIIKENAPELAPKTWYGMPAYARDGAVVCFLTYADKFKTRYATLGFNDSANLDEGPMWPTSFALKEMTPEVEARIAALVKQAVS